MVAIEPWAENNATPPSLFSKSSLLTTVAVPITSLLSVYFFVVSSTGSSVFSFSDLELGTAFSS